MPIYKKYPDKLLLDLLKEDDQQAYTVIFNRYCKLLINHAYKILQNQDEANDIVQEVFLAIWNKRNELNIKGSLSSYLYKATKNRILNHIAHEKVVSRYAESISNFTENNYAFADANQREEELSLMIAKEIESLPDKMREIFVLRKIDHFSYDEIANQLNISDKTAKQQVYNALKKIRAKINPFLIVLMFRF
ncbi:RNA polymerase sigma factor [Algibacter pectinivorans]|uniref:RNA polymerase sigma-70 factor, ECF subfamily n=1 Tax=Algibacter pectinivorans TaxID=870482 RepID=A0A1I1RKY7_9FLAO|nr:RNA polymerase sigma-70 factor [Algibacter pectinivorans]SFD35006.1 RNA polymerase sigma-70 factor, ECF subfamily [Algibacter pectinivorans]